MRGVALACLALLLPVGAAAQSEHGVRNPAPTSTTAIAAGAAPLSKAQVWQILEDRGYFEIGDLRQRSDGSWDCTAMIGPNMRVPVTVDRSGKIGEPAR